MAKTTKTTTTKATSAIPDHATLKRRQREERAGHSPGLALRTHRALSWLHRAEQCDDVDGRFIFLWIAFNAAYAQDIGDQPQGSERRVFSRFLKKLVGLDRGGVLYELIWREFTGSIRLLLNNQYVYQPFWDYHNATSPQNDWKPSFARAKAAASRALARQDTLAVLAIVLDRMYTLRNQLVHGGATWNGKVNRDQLRDCCAFLGKLVPYVILLMLDNPKEPWGGACYPVVDQP